MQVKQPQPEESPKKKKASTSIIQRNVKKTKTQSHKPQPFRPQKKATSKKDQKLAEIQRAHDEAQWLFALEDADQSGEAESSVRHALHDRAMEVYNQLYRGVGDR